jgi:predicted TIM-barrel fold metal-dependent hydrolase
MIIDVRWRPPYKGFLKLHVFARDPYKKLSGMMGVDPSPSLLKKSVPMAIEEMKRAGITKALVINRRARPPYESVPNEDVLSFVRENPKYFHAVPALEPANRSAAMDELDELFEQPEVKGIHIEPGFSSRPMRADDANLYPIYEKMARKGMPVLVSAGGTEGPDMSYVDPVHVHRVAKDFPNLKLVVTHGGYPYVQEALFVAFDCSNVYLSPDMYLNIPNMPGVQEYVKAANYFLGDRLLFGTAYPVRPVMESVESFNKLPFDPGVKEKVLYHNAAQLFGI